MNRSHTPQALMQSHHTSSWGKVQASPSTSIPSVARKSRSEALDKITNDSGLSWILINSTINFTILWLILHIFWPWSSSLAIQGCNSLSAWQEYKVMKLTKKKWSNLNNNKSESHWCGQRPGNKPSKIKWWKELTKPCFSTCYDETGNGVNWNKIMWCSSQ